MAVENNSSDTIAAPITGSGRTAVHVVRVSGPDTRAVLRRLLPSAMGGPRRPRRLVSGPILDILSSPPLPLDYGLSVFFPGPHSFTGEDCAEFHLHGSPFLVSRLLENLKHLGARLAAPGEFSERAFLNGRMDLSQAEAVADIIAAETELQARAAREQLEGRLSQAISTLGDPLRDLLAEIEAYIDFPDEDIEPLRYEDWQQVIEGTRATVTEYVASFARGKVLREGAAMVLAGAPNAGKSSLLNRLTGENRVIVTAIPGTTRDSIEERINLGGLCIRCWDTAGLADESQRAIDEVERLGIERSWQKVREADLVLAIIDSSADLSHQLELFLKLEAIASRIIPVLNKADLLSSEARETWTAAFLRRPDAPVLVVSAQSGEGMEQLKDAVVALFSKTSSTADAVVITTLRHAENLARAEDHLRQAANGVAQKLPPEIIAFELRTALGALSDIIGVTCSEDILGLIFSKFCIGK